MESTFVGRIDIYISVIPRYDAGFGGIWIFCEWPWDMGTHVVLRGLCAWQHDWETTFNALLGYDSLSR